VLNTSDGVAPVVGDPGVLKRVIPTFRVGDQMVDSRIVRVGGVRAVHDRLPADVAFPTVGFAEHMQRDSFDHRGVRVRVDERDAFTLPAGAFRRSTCTRLTAEPGELAAGLPETTFSAFVVDDNTPV